MNRPTYSTPVSVAWLFVHATVCDECGAIVAEVGVHDRWHDEQARVMAGGLLHPDS